MSRLNRKSIVRKGQEAWSRVDGKRQVQVDHLTVSFLPSDVLKVVARQCAMSQALYSLAIMARQQAKEVADEMYEEDACALEDMGKQYWTEHKKMAARESDNK